MFSDALCKSLISFGIRTTQPRLLVIICHETCNEISALVRFQSKLQTHVVDIVYLAEMIYLQHMKESINLKYVSVNSSK